MRVFNESEIRSVVLADRLDQCVEPMRFTALSSEIHHAIEVGVLSRSDVAGGLADVLRRDAPARRWSHEITVTDLTGVGVQDAAVANLIIQRCTARNLASDLVT